jgi:hypothetical protein
MKYQGKVGSIPLSEPFSHRLTEMCRNITLKKVINSTRAEKEFQLSKLGPGL